MTGACVPIAVIRPRGPAVGSPPVPTMAQALRIANDMPASSACKPAAPWSDTNEEFFRTAAALGSHRAVGGLDWHRSWRWARRVSVLFEACNAEPCGGIIRRRGNQNCLDHRRPA